MVHLKIKTLIAISSLIMLGCRNSSSQLIAYCDNELKSQYCFREIRDTLDKINGYQHILSSSTYSHIDKLGYLKLLNSGKNTIKIKVQSFLEESNNVEAYLLTNKRSRILIFIGKAAGASGIGVDYWNYQCYSLDKDKQVLEFSSLIKTPYSVYTDSKGELNHLEIEDNYPRPANGEEVKIDYIPLLIHVFKVNKEFTIEFKCKN